MKKRLLALLTTISMLISLLPMNVFGTEIAFSDMPDDYSTLALKRAVDNGLLTGFDGKIRPVAALTRAELATVIVRMFGAETEADLSAYDDVLPSDWYYSSMAKVVGMKLLQGSHGHLYPNSYITRQEVFAVLARAFKLEQGEGSDLELYSDKSDVASWALESTAGLVKAGYIKGSGDKLNPRDFIKRKDFAVIMDNVVKNYINKAEVVTKVDEGSVLITVPDAYLKDLTVKGDIIIGDGVGQGDVTLDNVTIEGRMIVRGGGLNSIIVKGSSRIPEVIIVKADGNVRLSVQDSSDVEIVYAEDGRKDIVIEGKVTKLVANVGDVPIIVRDGELGKLEVPAENAKIIIEKKAKVNSVSAQAEGLKLEISGTVKEVKTEGRAKQTTIEVAKEGRVEKLEAAAEGVKVQGEGRVEEIRVTENNVSIKTKNTKVTVVEGVKGTKAGGEEVKGGETHVTNEGEKKKDDESNATANTGGGSTGGGGSDPGTGGGGSNPGGTSPTEPEKPEITGFSFTQTADLTQGSENVKPDKVVGSFNNVTGGSAPFTYALVDGAGSSDNHYFKIEGSQLKVGAAHLLKGDYSFRVEVRDKNEKTYTKVLGLHVNEEKLPNPEISLTKENTVNGDDEVSFSINNKLDWANYYYTLDGTNPTSDSNEYTETVKIKAPVTDEEATVTIKVIAIKEGYISSDIAEKIIHYAAKGKLATPSIKVSKERAENREVGLTFEIEKVDGVAYYYTTDGSEPTITSDSYMDTVTLTAPDTDETAVIVIKVLAVKEGLLPSDIATATISYAGFQQKKLPKPEILMRRVVFDNREIGIFSPQIDHEYYDDDALKFYYTINGDEPTEESTPVRGEAELSKFDTDEEVRVTIKLIAYREGYEKSDVTTKEIRFKSLAETQAPITDFGFTPREGLREGQDTVKPRTFVGDFRNSDVVGGKAPFSYSLVDGEGADHNAHFRLEMGTLYVKGEALKAGEYKFRVKVSDGSNNTFEKVFTLSVAAKELETESKIIDLNPSFLVESFENDGSISRPFIKFKINGAKLREYIYDEDVELINLPEGLSYRAWIEEGQKILVRLSGRAVNHGDGDDITNLRIKVKPSAFENSSKEVISEDIILNFVDAPLSFERNHFSTNRFSDKLQKGALYEDYEIKVYPLKDVHGAYHYAEASNLNEYLRISMDGVALSKDKYEVDDERDIIRIKKDYMNSLAAGFHYINFNYRDKDLIGEEISNHNNLRLTVFDKEDVIKPEFLEGYPKVETMKPDWFDGEIQDLQVKATEEHTVYYIVLKDGQEAPATAKAVVQPYGNIDSLLSGSWTSNKDIFKSTFWYESARLETGKNYDLYVVLEDLKGNYSDIKKIDFRTFDTEARNIRSVFEGIRGMKSWNGTIGGGGSPDYPLLHFVKVPYKKDTLTASDIIVRNREGTTIKLYNDADFMREQTSIHLSENSLNYVYLRLINKSGRESCYKIRIERDYRDLAPVLISIFGTNDFIEGWKTKEEALLPVAPVAPVLPGEIAIPLHLVVPRSKTELRFTDIKVSANSTLEWYSDKDRLTPIDKASAIQLNPDGDNYVYLALYSMGGGESYYNIKLTMPSEDVENAALRINNTESSTLEDFKNLGIEGLGEEEFQHVKEELRKIQEYKKTDLTVREIIKITNYIRNSVEGEVPQFTSDKPSVFYQLNEEESGGRLVVSTVLKKPEVDILGLILSEAYPSLTESMIINYEEYFRFDYTPIRESGYNPQVSIFRYNDEVKPYASYFVLRKGGGVSDMVSVPVKTIVGDVYDYLDDIAKAYFVIEELRKTFYQTNIFLEADTPENRLNAVQAIVDAHKRDFDLKVTQGDNEDSYVVKLGDKDFSSYYGLNFILKSGTISKSKTGASYEFSIDHAKKIVEGTYKAERVGDIRENIKLNDSADQMKIVASDTIVTNASEFESATDLADNVKFSLGQLIVIKRPDGSINIYTLKR